MTDNEIIKALEDCSTYAYHYCSECGFKDGDLLKAALDLINRQKAEIERLEHLLLGVMHFVDKWLDGAELKQDEVNRARAMREKTLQIVEKLEEENDFLKSIDIDRIKAEVVKEFAERLKESKYQSSDWSHGEHPYVVEVDDIDNLVKEMVGAESD